ncbi:MAG: STAS domain-containing protein [Lachnospiraceae bacterium]|nr:STAS domain-containing protein [Lachnospiraceae bacterium]
MEIIKTREESTLILALQGRLDTNTAPLLEQTLTEELDGVTELVLDFEEIDYISSAGLRVLLAAQKRMKKQGSMKLVNVSEVVNEIFEVTGFMTILKIE